MREREMIDQNDGGPAFPVTVADKYGRAPHGMSMRQFYKAAALTGLLAIYAGPYRGTSGA